MSDLPPPEESVVVPLKWETALRLEGSGYLVDFNAALLDKNTYYEVADVANRIWDTYLRDSSSPVSKLNSYLSFYAIVGVVWQQLVASRAIFRFSPEFIWIPKGPLKGCTVLPPDEFAAFFTFLNSINYLIISEVSNGSSIIKMFNEKSNNSTDSTQESRPLWLSENVLIFEQLLRWGNRVRKRFKPGMSVTKRPRVLIIGQVGKKVLLEQLLSRNQIAFESVSDLPISPISHSWVAAGQSVQERLLSFLRGRDSNLEQQMPSISEKARTSSLDVLLSDHQYDSKTRAYIQSLLAVKPVQVAFFPEGAQAHTTTSLLYLKNWYWNISGLTNFVLGDGDCAFHGKLYPQNEIIKTGYLGNTHTQPNFFQVLVKWYLNFFSFRSTSSKRRVFVSLEIEGGWLSPGSFRAYQAAISLLETLVADKYLVVAKLRHGHMLKELRKKFPSVVFFLYMPWQALARNCAVVIQSNSSLGIEALSLKMPVVVWKLFDIPMYSDAYSDMDSDVVRKVTRPEDLDRAIQELIKSPKRDFHKYQRFLAQDQHRAVDWVKEKLAQADARRSTSVPAARS